MGKFRVLMFSTAFFLVSQGHAQSCRGLFLKSEALNPFAVIAESVQEVAVDLNSIASLRESHFYSIEFSKAKAQAIAEKLEVVVDAPSLQTVVYPAAGYDAGTAFAMFPHATTVIGIDRHPFTLNSSDRIRAELPEATGYEYTVYNHINRQAEISGIAGSILGDLVLTFPTFRLIKIMQAPGASRTHGWIEFDLGPGTPVRRYIHWDHIVSENENPQWLPKLKQLGFQALLIKGSMDMFKYQDPEQGANGLLGYLSQNGGVVVDTDGYTAEAMVAIAKAGKITNISPSPRSNYVLTSTEVGLGYNLGATHGLGASIIEYGKP